MKEVYMHNGKVFANREEMWAAFNGNVNSDVGCKQEIERQFSQQFYGKRLVEDGLVDWIFEHFNVTRRKKEQ
jgi:mRNA deadenylase 3'-5' endonuclease subunit Ccr4